MLSNINTSIFRTLISSPQPADTAARQIRSGFIDPYKDGAASRRVEELAKYIEDANNQSVKDGEGLKTFLQIVRGFFEEWDPENFDNQWSTISSFTSNMSQESQKDRDAIKAIVSSMLETMLKMRKEQLGLIPPSTIRKASSVDDRKSQRHKEGVPDKHPLK